jgi:hypothetical protein
MQRSVKSLHYCDSALFFPGSYPEIFEKGKAPPTLPEKESFGCFL